MNIILTWLYINVYNNMNIIMTLLYIDIYNSK